MNRGNLVVKWVGPVCWTLLSGWGTFWTVRGFDLDTIVTSACETIFCSGQMCKELSEVMTSNTELHPSIGNYGFVASCNRQNYKNSGCYVKCQKGNWSKFISGSPKLFSQDSHRFSWLEAENLKFKSWKLEDERTFSTCCCIMSQNCYILKI